jgi:hypothetical protein
LEEEEGFFTTFRLTKHFQNSLHTLISCFSLSLCVLLSPSFSFFVFGACVLQIFLGGIRSFVNAFTTTTTVDNDADDYDESTPRSTTMMVFGSCLCCFLKCVSCFPVWWSFDKRSEALRGAPLLGPHPSLLSYHATEGWPLG